MTFLCTIIVSLLILWIPSGSQAAPAANFELKAKNYLTWLAHRQIQYLQTSNSYKLYKDDSFLDHKICILQIWHFYKFTYDYQIELQVSYLLILIFGEK